MLTSLNQFIPIQQGQSFYIKEQSLINNLMGLVGYEQTGNGYILFTEDITAALGISTVDIQLIVLDFDRYDDYDLLPLPADMAAEVIQTVAALLLQTPAETLKVDSTTDGPIQKQ